MTAKAAATAAATEANPATDGAKNLKTFRKSKDLEDFYRFINENGLRREAHHALEFIVSRLSKPKKKGRGRKAKTLQ
ncbi:MAG: hypothetical protein NXH75_02415 [Halobacteriovoraceae bacterium]|jgi:hypothetical protein|nr:hypothetical protein [Halobacteriovoraceae bacterium]